ncbi:hypothetical protein O0L34_g14461 [Tuta absoluta]|nr:hypothetical protein O0L34_g14461 [Tuta absoluta]
MELSAEAAIERINLKVKAAVQAELEKQTVIITRNITASINGELDDIFNQLKICKSKIDTLEEKVTNLEREKRKHNLVFHGIPGTSGKKEETILEIVKKDLEVNLKLEDIDTVRKMGKNDNAPLVIKLTTLKKKEEILRNKKKLKGSSISITEDYPKEVLEERKALREKLEAERNEGNFAFIKYNKLIVKKNTKKESNYKRKQAPSPDKNNESYQEPQSNKTPKTDVGHGPRGPSHSKN